MLIAILFENSSAWWLLLGVAVGLFYAYVFYNKQAKSRLKYLLFGLRSILVAFICFLLMAPLLSTKKDIEEKPLLIVAQDNSASIPLGSSKAFDLKAYQSALNTLTENLHKKYDIAFLRFGDQVKENRQLDFSDQETDMSKLFSAVNEQYGNRNIGAIVLASDGIINKGSSISLQNIPKNAAVYTIGLGDTTIKKDLLIRNVNYNRIVYLDNEFPLEINLSAFKSKGSKSVLNIESADGKQQSRAISIDNDFWRQSVTVKLDAKKIGVQKIKISLSSIGNEVSEVNNQQTIYVEVLEGKQKILLLANAPHPDLNAIKQSLSANKNYDIKVAFPYEMPKNWNDYSVIILHNMPSTATPLPSALKNNVNKPIWFIAGAETNLNLLNQAQTIAKFTGGNVQEHDVALNRNFYHFTLSDQLQQLFKNLPPLSGPSGKPIISGDYQSLFNKRSDAEMPLMFFAKGEKNTAFLLGEGFWRWRLENYSVSSNFAAFDEWVSKTIQFLSASEDKRKFKAYPVKERFTANEEVLMQAELYNDSYEPIGDAEIAVEIGHSSGKKYSYVFSKKDGFYELNAGLLPEGEYSYTAKTTLGGKRLESKGLFVVEQIDVEHLNTTADHQLLYNISEMSGGKFVLPTELSTLEELIANNEKIVTIVHTDHTYEELIDLKWIFFLLIALLSTEWFLRKRNGLL